MKNIWTIMKKEFSRFFKDKRLVLALVLPGILIYVIYSFLGQGVFRQNRKDGRKLRLSDPHRQYARFL